MSAPLGENRPRGLSSREEAIATTPCTTKVAAVEAEEEANISRIGVASTRAAKTATSPVARTLKASPSNSPSQKAPARTR